MKFTVENLREALKQYIITDIAKRIYNEIENELISYCPNVTHFFIYEDIEDGYLDLVFCNDTDLFNICIYLNYPDNDILDFGYTQSVNIKILQENFDE